MRESPEEGLNKFKAIFEGTYGETLGGSLESIENLPEEFSNNCLRKFLKTLNYT